MANLPRVTDDSFDREVLQSNVPVLVDFSATWCGPCKALAPTLEDLSKEYGGKVKIVNVDIDESRNAAQRFRIMSVPTMILFQEGQVTKQVVGNRPKSELASILTEAIGA
ncbi:MAG TPA: thioredoxin [Acidobacteriota bacterium]|nr:thioredoxin [Acidobacteriota bacterium]